MRYPGIEKDVRERPLEAVCARQWAYSVGSVHEALEAHPPARFLEISYEELVRDENVVAEVIQWLALPDPDRVRARYRDTLRTQQQPAWDADMTAARRAAALEQLAPWLTHWGYR